MSSGAPHDERAQVHGGDQPHPPSPLSEKQLTQQKYEKATRALMSYFQQGATSAHRLSTRLRRLAARFGGASTAVVAISSPLLITRRARLPPRARCSLARLPNRFNYQLPCPLPGRFSMFRAAREFGVGGEVAAPAEAEARTSRSAREIERAGDRKCVGHALTRGAVTHHHVHLVRLATKCDLRDRAPTCEALEARSVNAVQLLQRRATWLQRSAARGGRLPTHNHDHCTGRGNAVGGDLTLRRLRSNLRRSDHEHRARICHGAITRRLNVLPSRRDDDPNAV